VETVRGSARQRFDRLQTNGVLILQTAIAAGASWLLARELWDHPAPAFAPIAAVISLTAARGQSVRRATELVAGVAVGIGVADALVVLIGTGFWQIGAVVGLAMATALLLGAGSLFVSQAAVSAVFVVALEPPGSGFTPDRFLDALVGGVIALVVTQLLLPRDPLRLVTDATRPLLGHIAEALDMTADAIADSDPHAAEDALLHARETDDLLTGFYDAIAVARETAWLSPPRRRARGQLRTYADAARQVDYAVRNSRVLARAAMNGLRKGRPLRPLADPVRLLADAMRSLADSLADTGDGSSDRTQALAIEAARDATMLLDQRMGLGGPMVIGQVRATATDLLRGIGLTYEEATAAIDAVAPVRR
jgi:uncharacterized membrane protein YgaE (UPF0421/DUF939 family)